MPVHFECGSVDLLPDSFLLVWKVGGLHGRNGNGMHSATLQRGLKTVDESNGLSSANETPTKFVLICVRIAALIEMRLQSVSW